MVGRLEDKVALITGASRGIGRAIAEAYAREGAKIVLNARNKEKLEETAEEIRQMGAEVFAYAADVSHSQEVKSLVKAATEHYGKIDILVNNAGVYRAAPFMQYSFEDFSHVVQTNIFSTFHVTQSVLAGMIERGSGRVINIASTAGKSGSRNQSAYNASKHAIVGLTRCLALEMVEHGITVNAICPWFVQTDMIDSALTAHAEIHNISSEQMLQAVINGGVKKRLIRPEEVAHLAVYLGSDESDMINGQSWTIDGGYTMI